jgi:hypothetical protein
MVSKFAKTARTPEKDKKFLDLIAGGSTVCDACAAVGYSYNSAYLYRKADPAFDAAWDDANEAATQRMEREADRRAIEGYDKPVYHLGVEVGSERKFSDTLLIFRLKAKRPDVYRERAEVSVTVVDEIANRIKAARTREKK